MIIHCNICKQELRETGALLFCPPFQVYVPLSHAEGQLVCEKMHFCRGCYTSFTYFLKTLEEAACKTDMQPKKLNANASVDS